MNKPDICIYHSPCQDGFTAAWAIWRRWPDVEFVPGMYGQEPPAVEGKHVLLVDFSYKRAVLEGMSETAASVTVLDHHKSARADLEKFMVDELEPLDRVKSGIQFMRPIQAFFDMNKSGAMLAWEYAHSEPAPKIVRHVQDRDLWRFELVHTREFAAYLFSFDYDFEAWSEISESIEHPAGFQHCVAGGASIERKHHKDIKELLSLTARRMVIGGHSVMVANLPYTMSSDAANALAEGEAFGACYYDNASGGRVFSLRSKDCGADVSEIAASYGGGGHARAAGFTAGLGWEGE